MLNTPLAKSSDSAKGIDGALIGGIMAAMVFMGVVFGCCYWCRVLQNEDTIGGCCFWHAVVEKLEEILGA